MKKLFLIDAAGNLALFGLVYYWLGLGEASALELIWTGVLALVIALLAGWLMALPFASSVAASFRRAPLMLLWLPFAGALGGLCWWLSGLGDPLTRVLASFLRIGVDPVRAASVLGWVACVASFLLFLGWAVPVAARLARVGWKADWRPPRLPVTYWFVAIAYVLVGLVLPCWLFFWTPRVTGPWAEVGSFAARAGLAFVIYVGCWLAFARYLNGQSLLPEEEMK